MILWEHEKRILKVVEWAHRKNIPIERLTKSQILLALQSYLRDPSHA